MRSAAGAVDFGFACTLWYDMDDEPNCMFFVRNKTEFNVYHVKLTNETGGGGHGPSGFLPLQQYNASRDEPFVVTK